MLSIELKKKIGNITSAIDESGQFINGLATLNKGFENGMEELMDSSSTVSALENFNSAASSYFNVFYEKVGPMIFFQQLQSISKAADDFGELWQPTKGNFTNQLQLLSSSYESYLASHQPIDFYKFSSMATRVYSSIKTIEQILESILANLENESEIDFEQTKDIDKAMYSDFSIILGSTSDMKLFGEKIVELDKIYEEIALFFDSNSIVSNTTLIKIESGSLFSKFRGDKKVNSIMEQIIATGANYLFTKFTTEGKLSEIPKKVAVVREVIGLSEALKENGVDTSKMDQKLLKSSVEIADSLNVILIGEPSVTVNETVYSIGENLSDRYLLEAGKKLLADKNIETKDVKQNAKSATKTTKKKKPIKKS